MTRALIVLAWLAVSAPAHALDPATVPPADAPAVLTIDVQRLADGRWQVDYRSEVPMARLLFNRHISLFRNQRWQATGAAFETRQGHETLKPDRPTDHLTVVLPDLSETLVRDYELLRPFTDGSAALYTGHLAAVPVPESVEDAAAALEQAESRWAVHYRFHPRPGEWVVVAGARSDRLVEWQDPDGWGRYVYFGAIEPLAGEHVLAVIDPGLPAWTVTRLQALLPRLFTLYAERIGGSLASRPVVLFSYRPAATGGLESGGGALPGQLQLFLKGDDWRSEQAVTAYRVDHLLAHEAAHLWNHQRANNADADRASWMHEGGADALTHQALVALGRLDARQRQVLLDRALNTCLNGLRGRPLNQATEGGDFGLQYACGEVLYRMVAGDDPFGLTADLIAVASDHQGEYGLADFLAWVAERNPALADAVSRIAGTAPGDVEAAFRDAAAAAGLALEPSTEIADRSYAAQLAADALAHLMGQACSGRFSFSAESSGFRLYAIEGCAPFSEEREVLTVDSMPVIDQGAQVHDAVVAACARGGAVELGGAGSNRSVGCQRPLAPRAPFLRLTAM